MKKYDLKYEPLPVVWPKDSVYTVKCFSGKDLKKGASIGLKYRLYVNGWSMRRCLFKILERKTSKRLIWLYIVYRDNIPIGISWVARYLKNKFHYIVYMFVRASMRKQGNGKLMINQILQDHYKGKEKFDYYKGAKGSIAFYAKTLGGIGVHNSI